MTGELYIGYSLLLVILLSNYAYLRLSRNIREIRIEKELRQILCWFWDGTPEDELYAWYKVRMILKQRDGDRKKVEFADRKINELNKQPMIGDVSITERGELIQTEKVLTGS